MDNNSSDDEIQKYAEETNVTVEWVQKRLDDKKSFPSTILAQPFEVDDEPWGVLVLDSVSADNLKIKNQKEMQKLFLNTLDDLLSKKRWTMNEWIQLDGDKYAEMEKRKDGSFSFKVSVSPYNIPEAVRASQCAAGPCVIEFRYIGGNDERTIKHSRDRVTFYVGSTSYRIYKIEFVNDQNKPVELNFLIEALDQFHQTFTRPPGFGFYDVNKRVLQDSKNKAGFLQTN